MRTLDESAHTQSAGYGSLQWNRQITVYKRPIQTGKNLTTDSTRVSLPQEARVTDSLLVLSQMYKRLSSELTVHSDMEGDRLPFCTHFF